ncbi:MAG: LptF/LptG family permease [Verrucomicrobia bacterium]|nr:LptF/LptG family permease [Verrucomicrobiota bacterium]
MKIVEKYLWQSVLVPLFFVIAALFTLWLTFDIFDKIGRLIEKGPSAWLLTKYFLVQLPDLAQSILPVGVLFATLYVLAYFSRHRESVALLAAGMSPMILARPFLLCSAGLSLVLYFLSFSLSPTAQANREKVKRQIKKESTEENSFSQVVYRSPKMAGKTEGTIWYIGRLDLNAKTLQNVEILFRTDRTPVESNTERKSDWRLPVPFFPNFNCRNSPNRPPCWPPNWCLQMFCLGPMLHVWPVTRPS